MGVSVWLKQQGKRHWYTVAPMVFVSGVTLTSLVLQVNEAFFSASTATAAQRVNGVVAVLLFALAASLLTTGARALLRPSATGVAGTA
jgi:carbon starvation protein